MPRYRVRAVDRSGKRIVSYVHAYDENAARQSQSERGWTVLAIKTVRVNLRQQRRLNRASNKAGGLLFSQLGELLAAGVPTNTAVEEIQRLAPAGVLAGVWARIVDTMNEGASLVEAFEQHPGLLAPRHLAMLNAGHSQNELAKALVDVGEALAWRVELLQRWRQVSAYPLFSIAFLAVVCAFLITQVVPSLQPLLQPMADDLPWMTQKILKASSAFNDEGSQSQSSNVTTWFFLLLGIVCLSLLINRIIKKEFFIAFWLRSRLAQRWVWPFSVAVHAQTVHVLLKQNIPLPQAVSLAAPAAAWFGTRTTWETIALQVSQDGLFADAVQSASSVPKLYVSLIKVGELYGTLDKSTAMATDVFHQRFKQQLLRVDMLIGPVLLLLAGSLIGMVFIWIILPVYDVVALQGGMG